MLCCVLTESRYQHLAEGHYTLPDCRSLSELEAECESLSDPDNDYQLLTDITDRGDRWKMLLNVIKRSLLSARMRRISSLNDLVNFRRDLEQRTPDRVLERPQSVVMNKVLTRLQYS